MTHIAAIPTRWSGVQYRSLLEAKWGAFFDLLGWSAEYEPFEMHGWIPDFALKSADGLVLVEVKPITDRPAPEVIEKLERGNRGQYEVLLVGMKPNDGPSTEWGFDFPRLGWLAEQGVFDIESGEPRAGWGEAVFGFVRERSQLLPQSPFGFDFFHASLSYRYRISGIYEGDHHLCSEAFGRPLASVVSDAWKEACNRVQWKAPA